MRGLVDEAKKSKFGTANNNNNNNNLNHSSSSSGNMGSRGRTTLASASTSRSLKGAIKTPTTTTATTGGAAKKLSPQVATKSKAAVSTTTAAAATTTTTTTTTSSSHTASSSSMKSSAAKVQKGQNPPPQAQSTAAAAAAVPPPAPTPAPAAATLQPQSTQLQPYNNNSNTIALPKASHANTSEELAGGVQDTIYLCNFRVSVDGEWLCLKELQDIDVANGQKTVGGGAALINATGVAGGAGAGGAAGAGHVQQRTQTHHHQFGQRNSKRYSGLSTTSGGGTFEDNARDTAEIERSNLVNICKLVVKELLEQSLRYGRMLDSDHLPLQHFFIVIEHVLGHGLRPKKGLLGPRKELWDLLQSVETYCPEAQDITASVRDLPTVRTHIGRARAWLRIALMQKKLSDYLQALIEHREDSLHDYYEPHALMMSDEIVVIMGILVGLNVIDCNLCVKEEDLDSQQGVIDFSLYLRSSSRSAESSEESGAPPAQLDAAGQGNMIAVLDQKNYIEELNRHLNATVGNLQAKVESLTTTNALMKEDLAIARNSLLALQAENQAMRQSASQQAAQSHSDNSSTGSGSDKDKDKDKVDGLSTELAEERKRSAELDKELKLQISLKAESDMAMKLLEKDIHEKQDTIVSLRRQLDDIKQINLEMYRKLQDCKSSLTHKTELMSKLECQKEDMASTIEQLEKKWTNDKSNLGEILKNTSQTLSTQVNASEERAARAEAETRIEREWRVSLQEKELKLKEKIATLQACLKELNEEKQKSDKLKLDLEKARAQWSEAQTTLEELGIQLSMSKLKIAEYQDNERRHQQLLSGSSQSLQAMPETLSSPGIWAPDSITTQCTACTREFNLARRKHHCRSCGEIFCKACSQHTLPLLNAQGQPGRPVRVCDACYSATGK
ncbi:RUN and FYVE domain-containing protein 2 isoform X1 [Drosophila novamexicana]|uniref:RUN and FYVE domain-containing protein 2 isoform X1 n=1 Tax=Drosophila novamexicana TaxID=47314 RepID=UPI0011E5BE9B|nr:RUN and FYVE domain-containing protein 2 isoform X1 [Drosophila novamexicana]